MATIHRAFAVLTALVVLTGCSFENPLTGPSKDLNTWLLGVWEHKTEKGVVYRATITPKTGDRYWVNIQKLGKTKAQTKVYVFEAWISRVGSSRFLTMKCLESPGDLTPDTYVFAHYQVLDQLHVRIRIPQLDSAPSASSYELRKEVRAKLKDRTLYPDAGSDWQKLSEVYWATGDEPQPFQPLRFPDPSLKSERP